MPLYLRTKCIANITATNAIITTSAPQTATVLGTVKDSNNKAGIATLWPLLPMAYVLIQAPR